MRTWIDRRDQARILKDHETADARDLTASQPRHVGAMTGLELISAARRVELQRLPAVIVLQAHIKFRELRQDRILCAGQAGLERIHDRRVPSGLNTDTKPSPVSASGLTMGKADGPLMLPTTAARPAASTATPPIAPPRLPPR